MTFFSLNILAFKRFTGFLFWTKDQGNGEERRVALPPLEEVQTHRKLEERRSMPRRLVPFKA